RVASTTDCPAGMVLQLDPRVPEQVPHEARIRRTCIVGTRPAAHSKHSSTSEQAKQNRVPASRGTPAMLMPTIPGSFAELLGVFRGCFTAPTFTTFTALSAGLLAHPGLAPSVACSPVPGWPGSGTTPERTGSSPQRGGGPTTSGCCCAT